jgi:hypothetical protein
MPSKTDLTLPKKKKADRITTGPESISSPRAALYADFGSRRSRKQPDLVVLLHVNLSFGIDPHSTLREVAFSYLMGGYQALSASSGLRQQRGHFYQRFRIRGTFFLPDAGERHILAASAIAQAARLNGSVWLLSPLR